MDIHARPLDYARFKYHFKNGNKQKVVRILESYQNEDGGFAYALDPDSWNPNSTPVQTWMATEILHEINFTDANHPIIQQILKFLVTTEHFSDDKWAFTIPSNNDFPHASWWSYDTNKQQTPDYNPTIALVGFSLKYASNQSKIYSISYQIAKRAVFRFVHDQIQPDMHELACFVRFYEYISDKQFLFIDKERYVAKLIEWIEKLVPQNEEWGTNYIAKPSMYIDSPQSPFYEKNKKQADFEIEFILNTLQEDDTWEVPWQWEEYPDEWAISKKWWKADVGVKNLLYLKNFNKLAHLDNNVSLD
jgi:hypothetical protein